MTGAWPPVRRRGVAGADGDGEVRRGQAQARRLLGDAGQGHLQVLVDVDGEGPERRDVDDPGPGVGRRRRGLLAAAWAR